MILCECRCGNAGICRKNGGSGKSAPVVCKQGGGKVLLFFFLFYIRFFWAFFFINRKHGRFLESKKRSHKGPGLNQGEDEQQYGGSLFHGAKIFSGLTKRMGRLLKDCKIYLREHETGKWIENQPPARLSIRGGCYLVPISSLTCLISSRVLNGLVI